MNTATPPFRFTGGIYPSTFFMATGFHGFHVIIGTIFLAVCLFRRATQGHFKPDHHFGFEAAAWYWHFVDVVWLFLFICIYWWGDGRGDAGSPAMAGEHGLALAVSRRFRVAMRRSRAAVRVAARGGSSGLLTVRPSCPACGLDLSAQDAGDGPAVFVILFLGLIVVGLAAIVEIKFAPPVWVHLAAVDAADPRGRDPDAAAVEGRR